MLYKRINNQCGIYNATDNVACVNNFNRKLNIDLT